MKHEVTTYFLRFSYPIFRSCNDCNSMNIGHEILSLYSLTLSNDIIPRLGRCLSDQDLVPRSLLNAISNTSGFVPTNSDFGLAGGIAQIGKSTRVPVTDDRKVFVWIDVEHLSFGSHGR